LADFLASSTFRLNWQFVEFWLIGFSDHLDGSHRLATTDQLLDQVATPVDAHIGAVLEGFLGATAQGSVAGIIADAPVVGCNMSITRLIIQILNFKNLPPT